MSEPRFVRQSKTQHRRQIRKELISHGATSEQANMYCNLVDYFVDISKQGCVTEKHHVLCHIFPTNEPLFRAARMTSSMFRGNEKKLKGRSEIVQLYKSGKSPLQIGKKFGVSFKTIANWLREWKEPIRSRGEAISLGRVGNKKSKHKVEIIRLYRSGKPSPWIGKKFGVNCASILSWLREWKESIRSSGDAHSIAWVRNKKSKHKDEILRLYRSGRSGAWIGKHFGLCGETILNWLREWGIQIRLHYGRPQKALALAA